MGSFDEKRAMNIPLLGEDIDTRRIILQSFRDEVFIPRYEQLLGLFSRLSLDAVNANVSAKMMLPPLLPPPPLMADGSGKRPGTSSSTEQAAAALSGAAPGHASDGSTQSGAGSASATTDSLSMSASLLSSGSAANSANRSRATSNTSAGSGSAWHGSPGHGPGHLTPLHQNRPYNPTGSMTPAQAQAQLYAQHQQVVHETGARLTETIGRMLQCLSVLVSVQSGDEAQEKMERLVKALKWNWLAGGRGRTGRQRRGFVGARVRQTTSSNHFGGFGANNGGAGREGIAVAH
jgi:hypothetical protein